MRWCPDFESRGAQAAEVFSLAMRQLPNVTVVGELRRPHNIDYTPPRSP